jgi:hypothetical protein
LDITSSDAADLDIMTFLEILGLALLAGVGGFVWGNLAARERANAAIRAACREQALLFLDDTVALQSMWPVRNDEARLTLRRVYAFDYSDSGDNRRKGTVTLVGNAILGVHLGPRPVPEGEALH